MHRILLVEDDPDVRELLEGVLLDADYAVDATDTVKGGRALLDSRSYDLLLTDGRLPDGTGIMVADRAHEIGMKVLMITGYFHEFADQQRPHLEILSKPLRPSQLITAIERVLHTSSD
jgi:DNA-binding NtrC family response regulator